jgi:hypothetical protein
MTISHLGTCFDMLKVLPMLSQLGTHFKKDLTLQTARRIPPSHRREVEDAREALRSRPRRRPYGSSEVIHRSGAKAGFELWSVRDARL